MHQRPALPHRALDQRLIPGGEPSKRLTARAIDVRGSLERAPALTSPSHPRTGETPDAARPPVRRFDFHDFHCAR